jgi:O-antigen/teichoic acid export membrane protein
MLAAGQVVALAVGGVATIVLARILRPSGFGTYSVLSVSVSLAALVAMFGLDTHLIAEMSSHDFDPAPYRAVFRLVLELTCAICVAATVAVVVTTHGVVRIASLLAIAEVALTPFLLGRSVLLSRMQQGRAAAFDTANRLALLIGIVLVGVLRATPSLVWVMAVSTLAVAVEAALLRGTIGPTAGSRRPLATHRRHLLAASWPLAVAALAGVAYNRIDQILLAIFRGRSEVGTYAVAVNLATLLGVISSIVFATTLPGVIEAYRARVQAPVGRVVEDMALLMFLPGGLGIAVLAGQGGGLTRLIFGRAYLHEHALVAILAFAEIWVFAGTAIMAVLIAVDRRRALLAGTTAALVVDIILNLLLISQYGATAAAWASFVSYAVAAFVAGALVSEARHVAKPIATITVKVLIAASAGAVLGQVVHPIAGGIIASSVAYLAIAALLFRNDFTRLRDRLAQEIRHRRA